MDVLFIKLLLIFDLLSNFGGTKNKEEMNLTGLSFLDGKGVVRLEIEYLFGM